MPQAPPGRAGLRCLRWRAWETYSCLHNDSTLDPGRTVRMATDTLVHRSRPAAGDPEGALVLFHGRATSEDDLFPLLDELDPERRLLGAPPPRPLSVPPRGGPRVSLPPGGAHWSSVRQIGSPDPETFHATYPVVEGWLDDLLAEHGIPHDQTVIGGFSQGTVMSYALGLGAGRPTPAGILALSGFIPTVDGFELDLDKARGLPVAIGHGTYDPVIGVEWGHDARDRLTAAGADVLYRESPMAHGVDPGFIPELRDWLATAVTRAGADPS